MKYIFLGIICLLLGIVACEPVTSDITQTQDKEEAKRKRIAQAGVRSLAIIHINASGDTLPQRAYTKFNEHGESVFRKTIGPDRRVETEIKYTYTPDHQVATEKYYRDGAVMQQVSYQYGVSGKPVACTTIAPEETVKKQWVYDNDGSLQVVKEAVFDKMSEDEPNYKRSTVYVYEAEECRQKKETVSDKEGKVLEAITYKYDYNGRGRKVRERVYIGDERLVSETHWEYNQQGQIKYMAYYIVNEGGSKILSYQKKYRYNRDGLTLQETTGNAKGTILEQQFYEYQYLTKE